MTEIGAFEVGNVAPVSCPGEVDVTEELRDALGRGDDGLEVVCVVVRWTEGSYLEDQDAWKLSGLIRDVYALYPPAVSVFDISWELAGDGAVAVAVDVAAVGRDMAGRLRVALRAAGDRAGKESDIPNFKGSFLGRFPLVSADFWTSDHLSERPRSVGAFPGTRARGTLTLKRR